MTGGDAILGDYTGASLHILAGGSVTLGDVEINAADSRENSINPNNTALFNGSDTFASLSEVTLSDGRVINIDGSSKPTLDVRAGIDWNSFPCVLPSNFNPGNVYVNSVVNASTILQRGILGLLTVEMGDNYCLRINIGIMGI